MAKNIIDFNLDRPGNSQTPVGVSLPMFNSTTVGATTASNDVLFLSSIIVTASGSGYTSAPTVTLTMLTGSVINSASIVASISNSKVSSVYINGSGRFSLNSRISASLSGGGGTNARLYVSLAKSKNINSFTTNQPIYDEYLAAKEKLKLVLLTKKGEVVRNPDLGSRIYEFLYRFDNMDEFVRSNDLTGRFIKVLTEDVSSQVPELEVLEVNIIPSSTDINKGKVGVELITRHKISNRIFSSQLSVTNGILKEYFVNENNIQKPVSYFI